MACSNCYTGCSEVVSDKCVKYTGVDVPVLGIQKGDSLSFVEQALVTFLTSTLDGSGIKINVDEELYCTLISQYLQECSEVTALDLFKALIQASCSLQEQVDSAVADIATIEANYTIGCLEGVAVDAGTHNILQAVITKLCEVDTTLEALAADVDTNYVKLSDLDDLIASYIESTEVVEKYFNNMVPYTILPYYGSLSGFDGTGAGTGDWINIYLCNGQNGTPDLRGRAVVGAISGVPGSTPSTPVNPASSPFNPNYAIGTITGNNSIILDVTQIPAHNHTVVDNGHTHLLFKNEVVVNTPITAANQVASTVRDNADTASDYEINAVPSGEPDVAKSGSTNTGISLEDTGSGAGHSNIQPVLATYFIMYIPA